MIKANVDSEARVLVRLRRAW